MFLYRVVTNDNNILNKPWKGINTFIYDKDKEYLHFYFFPEHADFLQNTKYKNNSCVIKCDIPINLLEFGIGLYNFYFNFKKSPFLEARIDFSNFKDNFIIEKKDRIDSNWKNKILYKRYLRDCIYNQTSYTIIDKDEFIIRLNKDFNFLNYIYEDNNNYKEEELSYIKNILINLNERIKESKQKKLTK